MASSAAVAWREEVPAEPPPAEPSDAELVREVLSGAQERFEVLVRRHRARLRSAVRAVVRHRAEADDVVQQAFLQAFASLRRWSGTAPFSVWLRRIAVNEALMRIRSSRRLERAAVHLAKIACTGRDSPEEEVATREEMARVGAAFPRLPARHREILQLATIHELPRADLARQLGVSEGAVKVRLHRARQALRGLLDEGERDGPAGNPQVFLARRRGGLIGSEGREEPGVG